LTPAIKNEEADVIHLKLPSDADTGLLTAQTKVLPRVRLSDTLRRDSLTLQNIIVNFC